MEKKKIKQIVRAHYRRHGRDLPWRRTTNPYAIWVSEVMLQQTQVERVIPKYQEFLETFPSVEKLAAAAQADVLKKWQGLGYNRRAKLLHQGAQYVVREHKGRIPSQEEELRCIPGVGPYTAGAIRAFAYDLPTVIIETNIRTAYTHHFYPNEEKVHDAALLNLIKETLPQKNIREWYWGLMDYGAHLKRQGVRINSKSAHYTKQKPFKGSAREVRGAILRALSTKKRVTREQLAALFPPTRKEEVFEQIRMLEKEGMMQCTENTCTLH